MHRNKYGYDNSENYEEMILLEREEQLKNYKKTFDKTILEENPNLMYENTNGKSKRIRIIREIDEVIYIFYAYLYIKNFIHLFDLSTTSPDRQANNM